MSKNVHVENAGMAREVDMFDRKKVGSVLEHVGKIKPRSSEHAAVHANGSEDSDAHAHHGKTNGKSGNQAAEHEHGHVMKKHTTADHDYEIGSDSDAPEKDNTMEDNHFRFEEIEPPSSRRDSTEKAAENKKLLESVRHVEDRLKGREQINLTMMSIEVANLPSAHRFTKNCPWLKGSYGTTYSWVAEYQEHDDGARASWKNMRWSFNLERNEADRNDLVITVCSKNLILGRYVLGKDEFAEIPDTKTGYFEVSGDIISGIGPAGKIRILFLRSKAERPKGPMKAVLPTQVLTASQPQSPLKQAAASQRRLYVKVLSAAVMDLKSVHFLDVNCPFIAVEVGDWVGISDTAHNAGMAARWNSLNWKFTLTMEVGIHLMIHSKNVLIGRMHVSLEEIVHTEPRKNNIIEIIKHITDGRDVTGKVKLNLLAEAAGPVGGEEGGQAGTLTTGELSVGLEGEATEAGDRAGSPTAGLVSVQVSRAGSPGPPLTYPGMGDLAPIKPFMRVPFQINVHEVTLLDTVKAQFWRNNALAVNVVCGPWGKATDELKNSGSFAHWIDLKWKIPVKGGNNLRITAWSHGQPIGSANVTVAELLDMPTDYEQNTEIFAKLTNSAKEIVGKVKLSCKYESLISVVNDRIVAVSKGSASDKDGVDGLDKSLTAPVDFVPNVGTEKVRNVTFDGEDDEDYDYGYADGIASPGKKRARLQELSLPLVATIKTISVYDAVSVHLLKRNAPYIKFICDRKSATTAPIKDAGAVATWPGLDWIMKIREDSHVVAILLSGEVTIGKVEFKPKDLLHIPLNDEGLTEIKTLFRKDGSTTAKLHLVADLKNMDDLPASTADPAMGGVPLAAGRAGNAVIMQNGRRMIASAPAYGNTMGGLDGVSVASFSGQLPPLGPSPYGQQYSQVTPMTSPQGYHNASYYGTGGASVAQRVPTVPSSRAQLGNSMSFLNQFNASGAFGADVNNMFASPPQSRRNQPYFGSTGDFDQRSTGGWGSSHMLQQQQAQIPGGGAITIFDRNLITAENARKLGLTFNLGIQEIDLIDLPSVHAFAKNCPFVSAACGKWTASTEPIQNAGDTAFWTKLNWTSNCKSGGNLRMIVNSKKVVLGSANFSHEDLLNAVSDGKGLRRVTGRIMSDTGAMNGRIKVAYTMDVVTKPAVGSPQQQEQQARAAYGLGGSMSISGVLSAKGGSPNGAFSAPAGTSTRGNFGALGPVSPQSQRVPGMIPANQQSPGSFDLGDDSYYDELIDPDPRKHVEFPFNIHILEMSTLDLLSAHQLKKNQPIVKAFCDTFYSETKPSTDYADVTYFRELHWVFPVKERSVFKVTVASRGKDIGSSIVDLFALKDIPFDQAGLREMVLTIQDDRGRAAGKVRMVAKLSNAATDDYEYRHSPEGDNFLEPLGMDGVSVPGAGGAQGMSYLNAVTATGGAGSSKKRGTGPTSTAGGGGGGAGASVAGGGSVAGTAYGRDFNYLLQSQVEEANELAGVAVLSCTLLGVAVIDLRAVHTFAPNSPMVNIACGKVVATTPAADNAGKMANWEDLNIKMPIDRSSNLRVLISSRDKVVGQCSVNRGKLLGGRKNQKGLYVLFGELEHSGKPAGKIKFVYSLVDPAAPDTGTS